VFPEILSAIAGLPGRPLKAASPPHCSRLQQAHLESVGEFRTATGALVDGYRSGLAIRVSPANR
jgi:hypothetical protein